MSRIAIRDRTVAPREQMGMSENHEDESLVERAREGDETAFRALADRYTARLHARIRRRLRPAMNRRVAASDILQEALLTAFQRLEEFECRDDGSFERWLGRIVENKIREIVRRHVSAGKRGVGQEVSRRDRGSVADFAGGGPTPSQVVMGQELKRAIREAMDALPPDYRDVLRLLREERLTLEETAARLGRSKGATKMLYARALARLEEQIELEPGNGRRRPTR
jgi:RNA polymerase sigma-70 factor (ECF subfamily)